MSSRPLRTHRDICRLAGERGVHVLCQKALAPTFADAVALVGDAERAGIRLMVHDNFRFQPWHRELRRLLDLGTIGRPHAIACRTRMGDGWGAEAYLNRQPYFRVMPKLLVFETGVHFIDVFRYLVGDVRQVYAVLRRRNPLIAGEDAGRDAVRVPGWRHGHLGREPITTSRVIPIRATRSVSFSSKGRAAR